MGLEAGEDAEAFVLKLMRVAWGEVVPSAPLSCPPLSLWVWGRALRGLPAPALLIAVRVVGAPAEPRMHAAAFPCSGAQETPPLAVGAASAP